MVLLVSFPLLTMTTLPGRAAGAAAISLWRCLPAGGGWCYILLKSLVAAGCLGGQLLPFTGATHDYFFLILIVVLKLSMSPALKTISIWYISLASLDVMINSFCSHITALISAIHFSCCDTVAQYALHATQRHNHRRQALGINWKKCIDGLTRFVVRACGRRREQGGAGGPFFLPSSFVGRALRA